jgi:CIC family chloride channel protein
VTSSSGRGAPRQVRYLIKWLALSLVIGAAAGTLVWIVQAGVAGLSAARTALPVPYPYIFPALGGLIVGFVIHRVDEAASGFGSPTYIHSVQRRGGYLEPKTVLLYLLATVVTLGSGGSGGFVGPACLIGGGAGSILFRKLRVLSRPLALKKGDMRLAMVCGAGAGVAAALDAPIGGGIFAAEVLYAASLEYEGLFPALLASVTGYSVHSAITEFGSPYRRGALMFDVGLAPGLVLTAVLASLIGILFVFAFKRVFDLFQRHSRLGRWRPAIGGLLCAALGFALQGKVLGPGAELFSETLEPDVAHGAAVVVVLVGLLLVGKLAATVFTVGSGNPAGLTFPVLLIGALGGKLVASVLVPILGCGSGSAASAHIAYVATGMAGLLAAVLNVPIAALVIVMEIFGTSYAVPAALGSIIAFTLARSDVVYRYLEKGE